MRTLVDELVLWDDFLTEQEAAAMLGVSDGEVTGGANPVSFPATKLRVLVELYLGGQWVDVSRYVLWKYRIRISRGRKPNQRRTQTAQCALTFRNDDKRFAPRNINGPYAGLLRRNTPLRVSVDPGSGLSRRFTGRVPSWVPQVGGHPNEREVPIVAVGQRGRLARGNRKSVPKSPPRRFIPTTSFVWAYWPLEAGAFADTPGLPDVGGNAMRPHAGTHPSGALIGYPQWGSGQLAPWLPPVLSRSGTSALTAIWAPVDMTFNTSWSVHFGYNSGTDAGGSAVDVNPSYLGGALGWPQLSLDPPNQQLSTALNGEPETVVGAGNLFDGLPHAVSWTVSQFGGFGLSEVWIDGTQVISQVTSGAMTVPPIRQLGLVAEAQGSSGIAMGHVAVWSPGFQSDQFRDALLGYQGESPTDRFARLCLEENLPYSIPELVVDNQQMGPQRTVSVVDLLGECGDANEGVFDEDLNDRMRLVSRTWRYNREVALTIDYAAGHVQPPFKAADDDQLVRNDWTLTREGGSPQQYVKTSGPMNVNDPDTDLQGIGRLDDGDAIVVDTDTRALLHAGYRVQRDTVDEPRFPSVKINFGEAPELIPGWLRCDVGSRVVVASPPAEAGPVVDTTLEGYDENIDQAVWDIDAYLEPDAINKIARYGIDRYDVLGCTLAEDLDTSETGVDVAIAGLCVWGHSNGDYTIKVDFEEMTVTVAAAAAGSPGAYTQTLTVQRGANGTTAATHAVGAEVHLSPRGRYAL